MNSCRIERKRAHDREAQRASRAKTKSYIAHLEKTVADLTTSTGDGRANYLAEHSSKQANEIESLQNLLGKIRSLVQDASSIRQGSLPDSKSQPKDESSNGESVAGDPSYGVTWDSPSEDQWPEAPKKVEPKDITPVATKAIPSTRNLMVLGVNMFCEDDLDTSYVIRVNEAITKVEQTADHLSSLEEDEDIMVRAIICGWDAAERLHDFDIVWRFLRAFDEGIWYRAAPLERLANLWQMRSTMLHRIRPKDQSRRSSPSFMTHTRGQRAMSSRPAIIDYFGWPQVRNQLLVQGIGNCTGKAAIAFIESFRFVWPYELRDAYKIHRTTGMYRMSEGFVSRFDDLSSFRLLPNDLIPSYVHPSLASAADPVEFQKVVECSPDSSNDSEDVSKLHGINDHAPMHSVEEMTQTNDWLTAFGMEFADATQYPLDMHTLAHEGGMSQWAAFGV